ncbi:MAG: YdbL family protein [Deltaproteobacteria bacterium]|jgi:uncharacterized protein YdbL (DUF1318 family)|nr:YdbL family protein [Deltaproteobacteria bacterium]
MRRYSQFFATVTLLVLCVFAVEARCFAGADDIKARMQERLPTIVQMKADNIIGENNKGYLEFVPGGSGRDEAVIKAENSDRQAVYSAIAKQQKTSAELVGERRAIQISERAKPGEWIQDKSGKWLRK